MTDSLCIVCKTIPQDFEIVDQIIVCCVDCVDKFYKGE